MRGYSDAELAHAVSVSHSWRGVLRALGLSGTSAASIRSVRRHADRLLLDYSHFTGKRRWSDGQLVTAIAAASTWSEVVDRLGLAAGSSEATVRGHAVRLGLATDHLNAPRQGTPSTALARPALTNLRRAGSLLAAAWFELSGHRVSWPLEPDRYDLLVWMAHGASRVQVKTATRRSGRSWAVWLSQSGSPRRPYDPQEIDQFFIVDGDLAFYLIPVTVVGGLHAIQLSAYQAYRLPSLDSATVESSGARPD